MAKQTDRDWLDTEPLPEEIKPSPAGGFHIPIEKLRPLLDRLNASSKNFKSQEVSKGYGSRHAYGSIELTVTIDGVDRTAVGAYNMDVSRAPNGFWNGTLKSECIKNAAIEFGKRLGRGLNAEVEDVLPQSSEANTDTRKKPDAAIMKRWLASVEKGDEKARILLENVYMINPTE